jgi:hypothetical protein
MAVTIGKPSLPCLITYFLFAFQIPKSKLLDPICLESKKLLYEKKDYD